MVSIYQQWGWSEPGTDHRGPNWLFTWWSYFRLEPDEPKRGLRKEEGDQQEEGGGKQGHLHQDIGCEYLSILGLVDIDLDPDIENYLN